MDAHPATWASDPGEVGPLCGTSLGQWGMQGEGSVFKSVSKYQYLEIVVWSHSASVSASVKWDDNNTFHTVVW